MKEELKKKLNEFYKDASREELILMLLAARKRDKTMYRKKITIKPAEMEKVEDIMRVFGPYIREHCYIDILISSKFGIIRMDTEGDISQYSNADELFHGLIISILYDIREVSRKRVNIKQEEEEDIRRRAVPLIEQLQDSQHYMKLLEDFLENFRENDV